MPGSDTGHDIAAVPPRLPKLLPAFILRQHAAGEERGRFPAAGLFVDISGFTAATNALVQHGSEAAEAMADVMLGVFEPLVDAVYAHGGWITTFAGDAFTALFPVESFETATRACLRALAAGLAIQQHVIAHPVQTTPYGQFPFTVKLGLGHGQVEWGILVPEQAGLAAAYYFGGPAIESAAGAEHQARPGTLVLSPSVHAVLGERVRTLPAGDAGQARLLAVEGELPAPQPLADPEPLPGQEAFIPRAVLERQGLGEFRQVVTVFVNLVTPGPASAEGLAPFVQAVFDLQVEYGGYLARVDLGDKGCTLLLFWGMPVSTENDVERALGLVHELGQRAPGGCRVGVTYRPMYTGLSGSARRGEYSAYGGGVSYAGRLMQAAPWGSTWLDERVARRAEARFAVEPAGEHLFKGFAEPQRAYALGERRALEAPRFYRGEMIGRGSELARLHEFARPILGEPAPAGRPRFAGILAVEGEAGLGKSRLVSEFLQRFAREAGDPKPQCFLCQTDQAVRRPLNPFRYWLRGYFEQSPAHSPAENKQSFDRALDRLVAAVPDQYLQRELERGRSFLGALVELYWENSPYARLDAPGRHELTVTALKSLILAESLLRPVVINLEDAHGLDAGSIEFVERLVRNVDAYPLAILATARPPVGDGPLFGAAPYRRLVLGQLSGEDLARLAADLLGAPAGEDLVALLADRAEGNPFFAEQILLYLREEGEVEEVEGTWRLRGGASAAPLPADVRAVFTARLDRLSSTLKEVVQTAAVLGREFEVQVLARVLGNGERMPRAERTSEADLVGPEVWAWVRQAEGAGIWAALDELRYVFKHALLRDAAYGMQLRARRRLLHRLAAEALETLYAGELAPHCGEIAYHYEAACRQGLEEARRPARAYLQKAAEQAAADYKNAAAVDYFGRALFLTPETETSARRELLLGREAVYHLLGERESQAADLQVLEALAQADQRPAEQAEVALRRARLASANGNYPEATAQALAAIAAAQAAGDVAREASGQLRWVDALERQGQFAAAAEQAGVALSLAGAAGRRDLEMEGLRYLGTISFRQGDYAAARGYHERCLELARSADDRREEGAAYNGLGLVAWNQGHYAGARDHYEQSLATAHEIGDRQSEGVTLNNLGIVAKEQGDFEGARRYFEQSLTIDRELGARAGQSWVLNNLGVAARCQGDYVGARRHFEQALSLFRELGIRPGEGLAFFNLGWVDSRQGDHARAQGDQERALAIAREIGDRRLEGYALTGLGEALAEQGRLVEAIATLRQAIALRRELGHAGPLLESLGVLARAHLADGDVPRALAAVEEILAHLDAGGRLDGTEQPLGIYLACVRALQAGGDTRAWEVLQAAHDRLQEQVAHMIDEETRRVFMDVPAHREIRQLYQARTGPQAVPAEAAAGPGAVGVETPVPPASPEAPGEVPAGESGPASVPITVRLEGLVSGPPAGEGGTARAAITVNLDDLVAELLAGVGGKTKITLVISRETLDLYGCSIRLLDELGEEMPRGEAKRGKKGRRDEREA